LTNTGTLKENRLSYPLIGKHSDTKENRFSYRFSGHSFAALHKDSSFSYQLKRTGSVRIAELQVQEQQGKHGG
jgi:hypothetical protein